MQTIFEHLTHLEKYVNFCAARDEIEIYKIRNEERYEIQMIQVIEYW